MTKIPTEHWLKMKRILSDIDYLIKNFIGTLPRPVIMNDPYFGQQDVSDSYPELEPFSEEYETVRNMIASDMLQMHINELDDVFKNDLMRNDCDSFIGEKIDEIRDIRISEHLDDGYRQGILASLYGYGKHDNIDTSEHSKINGDPLNRNAKGITSKSVAMIHYYLSKSGEDCLIDDSNVDNIAKKWGYQKSTLLKLGGEIASDRMKRVGVLLKKSPQVKQFVLIIKYLNDNRFNEAKIIAQQEFKEFKLNNSIDDQ